MTFLAYMQHLEKPQLRHKYSAWADGSTNSRDGIDCLSRARVILNNRDDAVAGAIQDAVSKAQAVAICSDCLRGRWRAAANLLLPYPLVPAIVSRQLSVPNRFRTSSTLDVELECGKAPKH